MTFNHSAAATLAAHKNCSAQLFFFYELTSIQAHVSRLQEQAEPHVPRQRGDRIRDRFSIKGHTDIQYFFYRNHYHYAPNTASRLVEVRYLPCQQEIFDSFRDIEQPIGEFTCMAIS